MKKIFATGMLAALAFIGFSCGNKTNSEQQEEAAAMSEYADPVDEKLPYKIVDNVIFNENVPVVVDFYADWCNPCKQYAPVYHEVAEKYADSACFISLNTEEYPNLCETYEISSIPTTLFILPGGSVLGKEVGVLSAEKLETWVNQLIATSAGANMEL